MNRSPVTDSTREPALQGPQRVVEMARRVADPRFRALSQAAKVRVVEASLAFNDPASLGPLDSARAVANIFGWSEASLLASALRAVIIEDERGGCAASGPHLASLRSAVARGQHLFEAAVGTLPMLDTAGEPRLAQCLLEGFVAEAAAEEYIRLWSRVALEPTS